MPRTITDVEVIQAVREALATADDPEGFYTSEEWGDMLELSEDSTRKRIKKLLKAGRMERAMVRRVSIMDGKARPTQAYRFLGDT